jgi:ubiquinone/menaquinone biosynthesis C-methylase UbiE
LALCSLPANIKFINSKNFSKGNSTHNYDCFYHALISARNDAKDKDVEIKELYPFKKYRMFRRIIASQFKRPTGLFGIFTSNLMIKGNRRNYDGLLKDLNIQPHDKILEIGYGPGIGINLIAEKCNSCIIHGIDFSKLMYKRATKLNERYTDNNRVKLLLGDFLKTKIDTNNYDKIFCINVVYFWDDLQQPFERIKSFLKKGGIFCFYMAHKDFLIRKKSPDEIFNKYSIEQITEALKQAGFVEIDSYFDKGYYIKAKK